MKKALSLILALAMTLSLAACGSKEETPAAPSASTPAASAPAASENDDRAVKMVATVQLGNSSPSDNTNVNSTIILNHVYEPLVKIDEKTAEVTGRVAKSWTFADDHTYIDFEINPDVTFHDGSKVTAEDVAFSYDYLEAGSKWGTQLSYFESWEAVDEDTFRVYLNGSTGNPLLYVNELRIVSKASVEAAGDKAFTTPETSIGTGPYMYTEIDFDGKSVMKAYPDYYRGEADIKTLEWTYLTDSSTTLVGFQTGDFNFISLPTANVAEMEATNQYNVIYCPSTHNTFLALNVGNLPDPLVRKAILYAIDNNAVMQVAFNGLGEVSRNMADAGKIPGGYSFDDYYDYNPEKAKELLLEAGYTQAELDAGVPIGNIVCIANSAYSKAATVIQQMLQKVGLKIELTPFEQATVESMWYMNRDNIEQLTIMCHGDTVRNDASEFYTRYVKRFEGNDTYGYSDAVKTLGAEACAEFDDAKREDLWQQFWTAVKDDAIYYSLYHKNAPYSEILITLMGAFAQAESESISANVRWGKRQAMREGKATIQYQKLYAYRRGEDGRPEIIPEQAEVVKHIYNQFLMGASLRMIKAKLESNGIPNVAGDAAWTLSSIRSILSNEKYCGDVLLQKTYISDCISRKVIKNTGQLPMYLIQNHHEGIISREIFDAVQTELARRNAGKSPSKKYAPTGKAAYSSKYALSERLVCGECGTLYRRCTWSKNGKKRVVWRCVSRLDYGTKYCHQSPSMDEEPLQRSILAAINSAMSKKSELIRQITGAMEMELASVPGESMTITEIDRQLEALNERFRALLGTAAEGGEIDYTKQFKSILDQTTMLKKRRKTIEELRKDDTGADQQIKRAVALMENASADLTEWDEPVIRQLVDTVKVISADEITVYLRGGVEIQQKIIR